MSHNTCDCIIAVMSPLLLLLLLLAVCTRNRYNILKRLNLNLLTWIRGLDVHVQR